MFKKITAVLLAASTLMVGSANAQVIELTYKSSDNKAVVNLTNARSIEAIVGSVRILPANSANPFNIADTNGAVYAAIISDPQFQAKFQQVGATTRWINMNQVAYTACAQAKYSTFQWSVFPTNPTESIFDNCATTNAIMTRTAN